MVRLSVVRRKISQIEEHLRRIRTLPPQSIETFKEDTVTQDVLLFNLTQAVQDCIDIATHIVSDEGWGMPGTQTEAFDILGEKGVISKEIVQKMAAMVGFRNRVIHEYEELNLDIVYDIWRKRLRDIEEFCLAVVERFGV
jgi:uncharacterized protein YutE (UPF0331/DUF86 family)